LRLGSIAEQSGDIQITAADTDPTLIAASKAIANRHIAFSAVVNPMIVMGMGAGRARFVDSVESAA
jgi:hypothetical protein